MMLGLSDTLLRWPQPGTSRPGRTAVAAALARPFATGARVDPHGRSDALLCALLGLSLLCNGAVRLPRIGSLVARLGGARPGGSRQGSVAVVLTGLTC